MSDAALLAVPVQHSPGPAPRSVASAQLREVGLVAGGYVLLSLLLLYPMPFLLGTHVDNYGDPLLNVTILAWYAHILPGDPTHLFDFPFFAPFTGTLLYTEHLMPQGLMAWPIIRLTGNSVLAYNVLVWQTYIVSAVGVYLLVRRLTGSRSAAFIAGILFAFSPLRVAQSGHLNVLSLQWLPLSVFFVDRWITDRRWRDLALATIFIVVQTLSSYNLAPFVAVFLAIWCAFRTVTQPRSTWIRTMVGFAIIGAFTIAVNVPIVLKYQAVSAEMGFVRSVDDLRTYSALPQDYFVTSRKALLYGQLTKIIRRENGESELFPGTVAILAGLAGVVIGWRRAPVLALVVAAAVLIDISFGILQPTDRFQFPLIWPAIYDGTSVARGIRVLARAGGTVSFAIAILAGYGLAAILPRLARLAVAHRLGTVFGLSPLVAMCALVTSVVAFELIETPAFGYDPVGSPNPAYQWIADAPRSGPAVVLPIYQHTGRIFLETQRMYHATAGWRPLINGYSGFLPPSLSDLSQRLTAFPDNDTIGLLMDRGVSYIVIERFRYNETTLRQLDAVLPSYPLREVANFDDVRVYEIDRR